MRIGGHQTPKHQGGLFHGERRWDAGITKRHMERLLDTLGLTECSGEPFRHGGFARIDSQWWLRGSRQSFHWQKMCPESKSDWCTRLRPQGFLDSAVSQTPVFCLAKTVESTCPLWSPVRNADIRSSLLTHTSLFSPGKGTVYSSLSATPLDFYDHRMSPLALCQLQLGLTEYS